MLHPVASGLEPVFWKFLSMDWAHWVWSKPIGIFKTLKLQYHLEPKIGTCLCLDDVDTQNFLNKQMFQPLGENRVESRDAHARGRRPEVLTRVASPRSLSLETPVWNQDRTGWWSPLFGCLHYDQNYPDLLKRKQSLGRNGRMVQPAEGFPAKPEDLIWSPESA